MDKREPSEVAEASTAGAGTRAAATQAGADCKTTAGRQAQHSKDLSSAMLAQPVWSGRLHVSDRHTVLNVMPLPADVLSARGALAAAHAGARVPGSATACALKLHKASQTHSYNAMPVSAESDALACRCAQRKGGSGSSACRRQGARLSNSLRGQAGQSAQSLVGRKPGAQPFVMLHPSSARLLGV